MKVSYVNILEDSSVSLSTGVESTAYPLYRTYDRDIGLAFSGASTDPITIHIDQGTAFIAVDRFVIPGGHNLSGVTIVVANSSDDFAASTHEVISTSYGTAQINTTFSSTAARYWRVSLSGLSTLPTFSELWLGPTVDLSTSGVIPVIPIPSEEKQWNVENIETVSGQDHFLTHGDPKRARDYAFKLTSSASVAVLKSLNDEWEGSKPFFLEDHLGESYFVKLTDQMQITRADEVTYWTANMNVKEVID